MAERYEVLETTAAAGPGAAQLERVLLANRARFLDFLARRAASRAEAEDVLQSAYLRGLERGVPDDGDDGVVAWFYRVLRNALVDARRRRDSERRALEHEGQEPLDATAEQELRAAVCACLLDVLPSLRREYASVVRQVDLEERSIAEVADAEDITVNNATVRLHRARRALKRELLRACGACATHGCLDCGCRRADVSVT